MTKGLIRHYGHDHLHFTTFSGYRRMPLLRAIRARNIFVKILREVGDRYGFALACHVVMPEHVHLLNSKPSHGNPSTVMQVLSSHRSKTPALGHPQLQNRSKPGAPGRPSDSQILN